MAASYALAVLLSIYFALGWPAYAQELVPEGCYSPEQPYGCHGSFDLIWHHHTHRKKAVEVLGIAKGDCLSCHVTPEELWENYLEHYKSWYYYERAKLAEPSPPLLWDLNPLWIILATSWIMTGGLAALAWRRWM